MSFGGAGGRGRVRSEINITPLVDVVLVLLILFMVMTPRLLEQLPVEIPDQVEADLAHPPPAASQVVLLIAADGSLALNGAPLPRERLADAVRATFARRAKKLLFFDIDDRANYGAVVQVMDECRGAGVETLGLMTK